MENITINPKIHIKDTDKISKYGEYTVVESFSGDMTAEELFKNLVIYHIRNDRE